MKPIDTATAIAFPHKTVHSGPRGRCTAIIIAAAAILLMALPLGLSGCGGTATTTTVGVSVPNFVGLPLSRARAAVPAAGLALGALGTQGSKESPAGNVISQVPPAGAKVAKGTSIALVVSTGNPGGPVPNLVGMAEADARLVLGDQYAGIQVVDSYSDTAPIGQVVSQKPSAGTVAPSAATITLTVSRGKAPAGATTVPSVIGNWYLDAIGALQAAGFKTTLFYDNSTNAPQGTVTEQEPAAGSSASKGATISLTISLSATPPPAGHTYP